VCACSVCLCLYLLMRVGVCVLVRIGMSACKLLRLCMFISFYDFACYVCSAKMHDYLHGNNTTVLDEYSYSVGLNVCAHTLKSIASHQINIICRKSRRNNLQINKC
jgi:hypothetical protein